MICVNLPSFHVSALSDHLIILSVCTVNVKRGTQPEVLYAVYSSDIPSVLVAVLCHRIISTWI
jgi:hypothetical protein